MLSFDVCSLFTNVKLGRVIKYLLAEVKKDPRRFFNEQENGQPLAEPATKDLRTFLHKVLTDFNYFRTEIGVFKQKGGLGMGTSLSPLLAKLFMSIFEKSVVDKLIAQGLILKWYRYVDDLFCILLTDTKEKVFKKLNSWDSQLKFTKVEMDHFGLNFLIPGYFMRMGNFNLSSTEKKEKKLF